MGMESVFRVSLVLDLIDKMSSGVDKVAKNTTTQFDRMNKSFASIQKAGAMMAGAGTAITGACLGIATSTFDTQDALGEVASLGVQDLQALEDAAKNFSNTWAGTTKSDFISAAYDIKSGIASLTDTGVAEYTELAALTAKATKATAADMTSLFATGYGIYKGYYSDLSDLEFGEMFSAGIAVAVKNYKTTGTNMADAIKMIGASATNAQVPMEEQLAILGQLQATMSGSEAGTKYKAFINSAAAAGEKLGLSFMDNNNQLLSMPEILDTLRSKYGDTIDALEKQELKEAFGTDEAIALVDLLYNNTDQLKSGIEDMQDSMSRGTEITNEMATAINNTPAQKFQQVKQQLHNVTEELGQGLLPGINTALTGVSNLIQRGSDWVAANQETAASVMRIVTILGILFLFAGAGAALIGTLGKAFLTARSAIGAARTALGVLNSTFLASPIGWVIAAIIALIAVFNLCGGDVSKLGELFQGAFTKIAEIVGSVIQGLAERLPELLQFGVNLIVYLIQGIATGLPNLLAAGAQLIPVILEGILQAVPALISGGITLIGKLLEGIITAIPVLIGMLPELFGQIFDAVLSIDWLGLGKNLVSSIADGFVQGFSGLVDKAKGLWDDFTGWLTGGGKDEPEIPEPTYSGDPASAPIMSADIGVTTNTDAIQAEATAAFDALSAGISTGADTAQVQATQSAEDIMAAFQFDLPVADVGTDLMSNVAADIQSSTPAATEAALKASQDIMSAFNLDSMGVSAVDTSLLSGITIGTDSMIADMQASSSEMDASVSGMQTLVEDGVTQMVSATQQGGEQIISAWTSAMNSARNAVMSGMAGIQSAAVGKAFNIASAIRSAFANMQITIPAPRLPQVSVSYNTVGSGAATATVPQFSVAYHADGGIMSGSTLMGFDKNGTAHIGGESGDEAILPLDTFWGNLKRYTADAFRRSPETRRSSDESGTGKKGDKGVYIQRLNISLNMDDMDSLKKLKKLLDEIRGEVSPDGEPVTA